jgi:thioredoxin-related protein
MKTIFLLLSFCLSALAADVEYPIKNFSYISDFDYREEVEIKDKYVVMVFSSKDCLERTIVDRSCWLFERKLDYFVPKFSPKVKVIGFNTFFENYQVASRFMVQKTPTVIILRNGQQLSRFEADYRYGNWTEGNWQDRLLKQVLDAVSQIR